MNKKNEILNSLSPEGERMYRENAIFRKCIDSMIHGSKAVTLLEDVCVIIEKQQKKIIDLTESKAIVYQIKPENWNSVIKLEDHKKDTEQYSKFVDATKGRPLE